jgi:hypothetical protein
VDCNQCGKRLPYEGNPKVCAHCGGDPLGPGRSPVGSIVMLLGAMMTIGLIAITTYIMYKRFVQH